MPNIDYKNKHFLIIDNIKASHDILKKFAMSLTMKQVDSIHYAKDAIPLCLEKQYDVIFLGYDLGEKQKNGQQLLEELRLSDVVSRHCVVIMVTAEVSQAMVLAALEHKPDSYLCKPYTVSELNKRLNNCARKKKAMASIYQALENDDKDLTITLVNKALANNTPYKIECLGIKSRQYFELQEFEQAKEIYCTYQNEKNCTWANIGLGRIALHEDDLTSAEKIFKDVIEQQPFYLPGYDWLASTYEKKEKHLTAEEILEQALKISPRSVLRLKRYAGLCYGNEHFEKATNAYWQVYELAYNSIHHRPENALLFVESLTSYSADLPLVEAKKLNNKAFGILSKANKSFNRPDIKIQSHLLSACLLENVKDHNVAQSKLDRALQLLDKEKNNIDADSLKNIANSLMKLNRNNEASQLLINVQAQQTNINSSTIVNASTNSQLNDSYAIKAQNALTIGKQLYEANQYDDALKSLNQALKLFPNHNGIKLNLLQVLLSIFETNKSRSEELTQAKKLILELITIPKNTDDYARFKKMKKKYQQVAGI